MRMEFHLSMLNCVCRWLYILIITIDANFRMKLKEKGILNDPALGDGWAHWTRSQPYRAYVAKYGHQVEVNHEIMLLLVHLLTCVLLVVAELM